MLIPRVIVLAALAAAPAAHAVNKCTMPDGRVVYSDAPCPGAAAQAQTLSTPPAPSPGLATPRPAPPPARAGQPAPAPPLVLQVPPPGRLEFSGLPQSDLMKAAAWADKIRVLGRDCEWALKVDQTKMQACVAFLQKVQPGGEFDQLRGIVTQVVRHEPAAARQSVDVLRKYNLHADEVLQYKQTAMTRLSLGR